MEVVVPWGGEGRVLGGGDAGSKTHLSLWSLGSGRSATRCQQQQRKVLVKGMEQRKEKRKLVQKEKQHSEQLDTFIPFQILSTSLN